MKRSLFKSILWSAFGATGTRLVALLSNLVLARLLMPAEFGVIGIAYTFWSFVSIFAETTTATFIVYKGIDDPRYLNTTNTISLIAGLILGVGLLCTAPLVAYFFNQPDLFWLLSIFCVNLFITCARSTHTGILMRRMQYRELANSSLTASAARFVSTTGCALAGLSYWSFAIGDLVYVTLEYWLKRRQSGVRLQLQIDPEVREEVITYCKAVVGSNIGLYLNSNFDNLVVGKILGIVSLGYYNFAYQLTMASSVILNQVISQVGTSAFVRLTEDHERERTLLALNRQIASVGAPLYALLFVIVDENFVRLVFGSKWAPACTVIPWLLVFAYFRVMNRPLTAMLAAKGRPEISARVNLITAPVAIAGFIVGASFGGILGVSIAVAVILGVLATLFYWWEGCRALGWSMGKFLPPLFAPALPVVPAVLLALESPVLLRPLVLVAVYALGLRLAMPASFFECRARAGWLVKRLFGTRAVSNP